uniref:VWFA domain-containing protein n=1 Tax=Palpitomonas bilix TaxID=652834 RepID=A0A7S3DBV5_9EUKA
MAETDGAANPCRIISIDDVPAGQGEVNTCSKSGTALYVLQDISASMSYFMNFLPGFFEKFNSAMSEITLKRLVQFDHEAKAYEDCLPFAQYEGATSIVEGLRCLHSVIERDVIHGVVASDMNILIMFITDGADNRGGSREKYQKEISSINDALSKYPHVASSFVGVGASFPTPDFLMFTKMLGKEASHDTMFMISAETTEEEYCMFVDDCLEQLGCSASREIPSYIKKDLIFGWQSSLDNCLFVDSTSPSIADICLADDKVDWVKAAQSLGRIAYRCKPEYRTPKVVDAFRQLKAYVWNGMIAGKRSVKKEIRSPGVMGRIERYRSQKKEDENTEEVIIRSNLQIVQSVIDDMDVLKQKDEVLRAALALNTRSVQSQKEQKNYQKSLKLRGISADDAKYMERELLKIMKAQLEHEESKEVVEAGVKTAKQESIEEEKCAITLEGVFSSLDPSTIIDSLKQSDHSAFFLLTVLGVVGRPVCIKSKSSMIALAPYSFLVDTIVSGNCSALSSTELAAMRMMRENDSGEEDGDVITFPLGEGSSVDLSSVIPIFKSESEIPQHILSLLSSNVWSYWCTYALYGEPSLLVPEAHLAGCIGIFSKLIVQQLETGKDLPEYEKRLLDDVIFTGSFVMDKSKHSRVSTLKEKWVKECCTLLRPFSSDAAEGEADGGVEQKGQVFAFMHELIFVWKVMIDTTGHHPSSDFVDDIFKTWASWIVRNQEKYNDGKSIFDQKKVLHAENIDDICADFAAPLLDTTKEYDLVAKGPCWRAAGMQLRSELKSTASQRCKFTFAREEYDLFSVKKIGVCGELSMDNVCDYFELKRGADWKDRVNAHGLCVLGASVPLQEAVDEYVTLIPDVKFSTFKTNFFSKVFDSHHALQQLEERYICAFNAIHTGFPEFEEGGVWPNTYCVQPRCPFYKKVEYEKFGFKDHLQQVTRKENFVHGPFKTTMKECEARGITKREWDQMGEGEKDTLVTEIRCHILDGKYLFPDMYGNKVDNYKPTFLSLNDVKKIVSSYFR